MSKCNFSFVNRVTRLFSLQPVLVMLWLLPTSGWAQFTVQTTGLVEHQGEPLKGVMVVKIDERGKSISSSTTNKKGEFKMNFTPGKKFILEFSKDCHVTMRVIYDANLPAVDNSKTYGKRSNLKVSLWEKREGFDEDAYLQEPIYRFVYQNSFKDIVIDDNHRAKRRRQLAKGYDQLKALRASNAEIICSTTEKKEVTTIQPKEAKPKEVKTENPVADEDANRTMDPVKNRKLDEIEREIKEKENRGRKTEYMAELLETAAEEGSTTDELDPVVVNTEKSQGAAAQVQGESKQALYELERKKAEREAEIRRNQAEKQTHVGDLLELAAEEERQAKLAGLTNSENSEELYVQPEIRIKRKKGYLATEEITEVIFPARTEVFRKVHYSVGGTYYYKDGKEIDESTFTQTLSSYQ